jgi:hypothetical protein
MAHLQEIVLDGEIEMDEGISMVAIVKASVVGVQPGNILYSACTGEMGMLPPSLFPTEKPIHSFLWSLSTQNLHPLLL